ncbi:MAG: hypothetical protein GTO63_26215 [Anaerolineae bacterium]|nr:hypothetical protein [Anaerolineae bacterium]NIN98230.1 hypothetical protein [Anaerolineae bacterium]NIQ81156.1 hypothetical protein [Anaerolineae bacterium]
MGSANKILVIGIDAAAMEFVQTWSDEGRLPSFKSFLEEGAYARLNSVPNCNSAPAWSSMVTGVNPGKHGIFWFREYKPHSYESFYTNASYRHGDPLWRLMSRAGRQVGIMNVPISYPAERVNGFLIAGLDAPGVDDERFSHPSGLIVGLREELGEYIIEPGMPGFYKAGRLDEGIERLHSTIDSRLAYSSYLMEKWPWDFFMVVFTAVDSAQHFFWKFMRPEGFTVDQEEREKYQHVIRDVYVHCDEAIGRLVELAGPSTTVFLVSDHGGDVGGKSRLVAVWLQRMGMLRYSSAGPKHTTLRALPRDLTFRLLVSAYRQADRHLERDVKLRLARMFPGLRRKTEAHLSFSQIDWAATKAFTDGKRPDIWINLRGRFPGGTVEPGTEYDEVCESIREQFLAMRNPRTGRNAVKQVLRKREAYHGPHLDKAPDLVVRWEPNLPIEALIAESARASGMPQGVTLSPLAAGASGGHGQYGVLLAKSPHIKRCQDIGTAEIADVAPTILHLAGLPVPEYMDGKVVEEMLEEEFLRKNPVRESSHLAGPIMEPVPYSKEEEATIEERLRGLGYVE